MIGAPVISTASVNFRRIFRNYDDTVSIVSRPMHELARGFSSCGVMKMTLPVALRTRHVDAHVDELHLVMPTPGFEPREVFGEGAGDHLGRGRGTIALTLSV